MKTRRTITIGQTFAAIWKGKGLTEKKLSNEAEISLSDILILKKAKHVDIDSPTVRQVMNHLNISQADLLMEQLKQSLHPKDRKEFEETADKAKFGTILHNYLKMNSMQNELFGTSSRPFAER